MVREPWEGFPLGAPVRRLYYLLASSCPKGFFGLSQGLLGASRNVWRAFYVPCVDTLEEMYNVLDAKEWNDLWTCSSYLDVDTLDLLAINRHADRQQQK